MLLTAPISQLFAQAALIAGSVSNSQTGYSVSPGYNRLLVVAVSGEWPIGQSGSVNTLTYKGQSLTLAIGRASAANLNRTEIWYLNDAGLRAAESCVAGNFSITWTGNTPATTAFSAMAFANIDQTQIIPAGTSTGSQTATPATSVTLSTVSSGNANDLVIYSSTTNNNRAHTPPAAPNVYTEHSDQVVSGTMSQAVASRVLSGAAPTEAPVATWTGGVATLVIAGVVFNGVTAITSTQRTFYSLADGAWDNSSSWSLTSDGSSGAVTAGLWPQRTDHVVIRTGHDITINSKEDNGVCGTTAEALGITGGFAGSNVTAFYQSGNLSVNGGSLTASVEMMLGGTSQFAASSTMDFTSFLINLGNLDAASGMTLFRTLDDLVLAGNSATVINTTAVSSDDLIISGTVATLCGTGSQQLTGGSGSVVTYHNFATSAQICNSFSVTCTGTPACVGFPQTGTGTILPGNVGPGGVGSSANNRLWLKANDLSLANGAFVTSWADASGNGFTAAANTNPSLSTANQPLFATNSVNGLPSLTFDGSDYLTLGVQPALDLLPQTDPMVFYSVVNAASVAGSTGTILSKAHNNPADNRQYQFQLDFSGGANRLSNWFGNSFSAATSGTPTGSWKVNSTSVPAAASGFQSWIDETAVTYGSTNIGTGTSTVDILVGARRSTTATNAAGFFLNASLAEIILYRATFGEVHRSIIGNYLSAKYGTTFPVGLDFYTMDDAGNGNHDFDVAGIGWDGDDNSRHLDSRGSGIVRVWGASGLAANEYLFWGHTGNALTATQTTDVDGTIVRERLSRVWRVTETGDVGTVNISFDLSSIVSTGSFVGSSLRLLIDTDNAASASFADNDVAPIEGNYSGSILTFTGVNLASGYRFTIGNTDLTHPLPIELVSFDATVENSMVMLAWTTETELNNDFFTIERSRDGLNWSAIATVKGAGNSTVPKSYRAADERPFASISYYRLKQTDFDKKFTYSRVVKVDVNEGPELSAIPNPSEGKFGILSNSVIDPQHVQFFDLLGRAVPFTVQVNNGQLELDPGTAPAGVYIIRVSNGQWSRSVRVVKK